jgi:hypothetical protein
MGEEFDKARSALRKARRAVKAALAAMRGVEFPAEETELLAMEAEALQNMSALAASALRGGSGVDFDAELLKIEERRQWGPEGRPWDYIEEPWGLRLASARINLQRRLEQKRRENG